MFLFHLIKYVLRFCCYFATGHAIFPQPFVGKDKKCKSILLKLKRKFVGKSSWKKNITKGNLFLFANEPHSPYLQTNTLHAGK